MSFDVIFVGGGLSAALSTLALLDRRPEARVAIIEREPQLGTEHTWCFHAADVSGLRSRSLGRASTQANRWLAPLVAHRWAGYSVSFPRRQRRLASSYACVTGERLHQVVSARMASASGAQLMLGCGVLDVDGNEVTLSDGRVLAAELVVDARGPARCAPTQECGYQKFLGLELEVERGHAIGEPILMDANLPQTDGLRFMYVLPFAPDRLLIEDTYFSDTPTLNEAPCERDVLRYAADRGLKVRSVLRRERGVLPMPWRSELPSVPDRGALRAGYAGGYFHPVTGYSFPIAVRFAEALAESCTGRLDLSPLRKLASDHTEQLGFLFGLTRSMFTWFDPEQRFSVLEHFYRLPEPLIERFYAATLTQLDRARILLGPPPRGISMRRMFLERVGALS